MAKFIYYAAIFGAVSSLVLLFGVAGASDTGAPMAEIFPRAVMCLIWFVLCSVLSHVTKN